MHECLRLCTDAGFRFVLLGESFSSGAGVRKPTRRLCSSADQRPQRLRLLDTILRKAPRSNAFASDSPTTTRSLRLYSRNARRTRTSGNSRRRVVKSVSPSCGTSRKGTGWKRPTPASCGWTTRRSEVFRYRPFWPRWSRSLSMLAPRRKAPCQLASPAWLAQPSFRTSVPARSAYADRLIWCERSTTAGSTERCSGQRLPGRSRAQGAEVSMPARRLADQSGACAGQQVPGLDTACCRRCAGIALSLVRTV